MNAPYAVTLTQVDDGSFIVQVGCKTIVFQTVDALLPALRGYFEHPEHTIETYSKKHGWPTVPGPRVASGFGGAATATEATAYGRAY